MTALPVTRGDNQATGQWAARVECPRCLGQKGFDYVLCLRCSCAVFGDAAGSLLFVIREAETAKELECESSL